MTKKPTYISLFSSAGVGCFGFKMAGFECISTCEFLPKRLAIQRVNNKCRFATGYVCGDINKNNVVEKIYSEVDMWKSKKILNGNDVDVVIATPPCQGMSVANQKKCNEMSRNSLVVKAIEIINKINPRIFIFENVKSFLKTNCIGIDGQEKSINDEINNELGKKYMYSSQILNFKNYGSNSSRTRTLVIGVRKDFLNNITPFDIFPSFSEAKPLKEVIKKFKKLTEMDEFDENNPLHHFKKYDPRMRKWIMNLKQGESAMDNNIPTERPHRIHNGKIVFTKAIFGDKYKRQLWNRPAPCIHTANDCLASQNTIHPVDDRVFSVAELMEMMSIPKKFRWDDSDISKMSHEQKLQWLYKIEGNARKCIGEAVPTEVFHRIAKNIINVFSRQGDEDFFAKSLKFEKNNKRKEEDAAFFTTRINLAYTFNLLPDFKKDEISILEPSVGYGNFLIPLFKKYQNYKKVNLTLVDISSESIKILKNNLKKINVPDCFNITIINKDYLQCNFTTQFDLIIGNPPFKSANVYEKEKFGFKNLLEIFWKISLSLSKTVILISPKLILFSPSYREFRKFMMLHNITNITDFGELGFKDVKIETLIMKIENYKKNEKIEICSIPKKINIIQNKKYIFDKILPYWIIYRDTKFDTVYNKMRHDIFTISKNYEISNAKLSNKTKNSVWVLRSKNISTKSREINHIRNYDRYANKDIITATKFYNFISTANKKLFLIPTLTYFPRVIEMPKEVFVNGSILVAQLKDPNIILRDKDLEFFYSDEFRTFYSIAFNYATRTLNIDNDTIKFFGIVR